MYTVPSGSQTPDDLVYVLPNNDWRPPTHGWYAPEMWNDAPARWMLETADLYIYAPAVQTGTLQFTALPPAMPQRLAIDVNGEPLATLVVGEWLTYTTPAFTLQPGLNQFSFRVLEGCTPVHGDPRCGGVARAGAGDLAECAPYINEDRCLGVLFQDVRFSASERVPVDVSLGEQIALLGYDLAGTPAAGETLSLTLYWQARQVPQADYITFVHLLGADGTLLAQFDGPPVQGVYPTAAWQLGDRVTQQVSLALPAESIAGTYDLVVGMYTYPEIVRLPVAGERPYAQDGLLWLQQVTVR